MLVDEGTTIVKLYLNVSAEEQRERLQDRIDSPDERWKFRLGDLDDRKLRPAYLHAYRDALARTSVPHAPWYVDPRRPQMGAQPDGGPDPAAHDRAARPAVLRSRNRESLGSSSPEPSAAAGTVFVKCPW